MNSTNGYLIGIWAIIGVLIAAGIALLTSGSVILAWGGVILMLLAIGGVGNWLWLAWRTTKVQLDNATEE